MKLCSFMLILTTRGTLPIILILCIWVLGAELYLDRRQVDTQKSQLEQLESKTQPTKPTNAEKRSCGLR